MITTLIENKTFAPILLEENIFDYLALNKCLENKSIDHTISSQGYVVSYGGEFHDNDSDNDGWLHFTQNEKKISTQKKHVRVISNHVTGGYKLHINIHDDPYGNQNNLPTAWNIIYPLLIKYNVAHCKIVANYARNDLYIDASQYAKAITVYCYYQKNFEFPLGVEIPTTLEENEKIIYYWTCLMRDITKALVEASIEPVEIPLGKGREDTPITGSSYFSYRNDVEHSNDYKNIFANIDLKDIKQIPRKKWILKSQELESEKTKQHDLCCKLL